MAYIKKRSRWKIIDADFFQNQSLEEDMIDRILQREVIGKMEKE